MDIEGKSVLVLGGWGLVGSAVCRRVMQRNPSRLIVTSLLRTEAEQAVAQLRTEFPKLRKSTFISWWGNIFVRDALKDKSRSEILSNEKLRAMLVEDSLDDLTEKVLRRASLYQLLTKFRPEIIIDCVNSATAIAYQDLFQVAREVVTAMNKSKSAGRTEPRFYETIERLLCTLYTPQLIRHVQILYQSMNQAGTRIYVKIGTSGTGGMGLNIPYTHSEERPSRVLLGKSAIAGAHTLLLFLMGRTPDAPITKEIKPAAAIAWKKIAFGEIKRQGKPILLFDCPPEKAIPLEGKLQVRYTASDKTATWTSLNEPLKSVFIDTGENGIFSRGEFEAISTPGQMEFVTPEEIAQDVVFEILGGNTGHDIINALDNATLAPTYRAGFLFNSAIKKLEKLEKEHGVESVAFEVLGPPRLSKLLFEAHLLRLAFSDMKSVVHTETRAISKRLFSLISENKKLRAEIISIGIPILLPDGKTLLRGPEIKIPTFRGINEFEITLKHIDLWAHDGWVDLRGANIDHWKDRFRKIMRNVDLIPSGDTSSQFLRTNEYWKNFTEIDPGKIVGWIFSEEEQGMRMKA
ncbi:MAG TPA: short-chain dehydrogenase [Bacteroidota bacterium]